MDVIRLQVGQDHLLRFGGLGSAGYIWDFIISGPNDIVTIERKNPETDMPDRKTPRTYSVDTLFMIHAISKGRVKLDFILHRPWIKSEAGVLKRCELEVLISE